MQSTARTIVLGLALTVVAACGGEQAPQDKADAAAKGRSTDETVFDDLIQTQDRARGVEDTVMAAKGSLDATIEEQSGDGSADPGQ